MLLLRPVLFDIQSDVQNSIVVVVSPHDQVILMLLNLSNLYVIVACYYDNYDVIIMMYTTFITKN
jgi:hypothetical protein